MKITFFVSGPWTNWPEMVPHRAGSCFSLLIWTLPTFSGVQFSFFFKFLGRSSSILLQYFCCHRYLVSYLESVVILRVIFLAWMGRTKIIFIFFEFSTKIFLNHDNLLISFTKFLKENNLKIFNSEFYEVKIEDLFDMIKYLPKEHEVVGNYIISKNVNFS